MSGWVAGGACASVVSALKCQQHCCDCPDRCSRLKRSALTPVRPTIVPTDFILCVHACMYASCVSTPSIGFVVHGQAQFDENVLKLPDLKCFAAVQRHGLITDKAALVQQGLRLMGACVWMWAPATECWVRFHGNPSTDSSVE